MVAQHTDELHDVEQADGAEDAAGILGDGPVNVAALAAAAFLAESVEAASYCEFQNVCNPTYGVQSH